MKNKLGDLNDHLFTQMERMAEEGITPENLAAEVKRAQAMVAVADQIVRTGDLQLRAAKMFADHGDKIIPHLPLIGRS
jgi:hypothetical protein